MAFCHKKFGGVNSEEVLTGTFQLLLLNLSYRLSTPRCKHQHEIRLNGAQLYHTDLANLIYGPHDLCSSNASKLMLILLVPIQLLFVTVISAAATGAITPLLDKM